jgi:hypothetical protein
MRIKKLSLLLALLISFGLGSFLSIVTSVYAGKKKALLQPIRRRKIKNSR